MRKYFKSNPLLFYIWYKLYRSRHGVRIDWFRKTSELYFDGYPRSGNTFLLHLLKGLYPDKHIVHHFHAVAPLKIALQKGLKSVVIFRKPSECISSNYLKQFELGSLPDTLNKSLLLKLTEDYINYYKFVIEVRERIFLIDFEELIKAPEDVLIKINKFVGDDLDQETVKRIISERKLISFGSKSDIGSSLPNEIKEKLKSEIKIYLREVNQYRLANKIFIILVDKLS